MKKVGILAIIAIGFAVQSCNKCQDCHYDMNGEEVEIGELCDEELENAEANGYSLQDTVVTIHCEEH
ncbi:MAG: hypothetical protein ACI857_000293 [Arenicella sp.]|jgi:hypothetical protein